MASFILAGLLSCSCSQDIDSVCPRDIFYVEHSADLTGSLHINAYASELPLREDDCGRINSLNLLYMEEELLDKSATISIDNVHFCFAPEGKVKPFSCTDWKEDANWRRFEKSKVEHLKPYLSIYDRNSGIHELYSFAEMDGGLKITADKMLFGRQPGEDISNMFIVTNMYPDLSVSFPDFNVVKIFNCSDKAALQDVFSQHLALCQSRQRDGMYEIAFLETPEEKYDSITFTFTLPVIKYDYYKMSQGNTDEVPTEKTELTGTTTVYFGKSVLENWSLNKVVSIRNSWGDAYGYW